MVALSDGQRRRRVRGGHEFATFGAPRVGVCRWCSKFLREGDYTPYARGKGPGDGLFCSEMCGYLFGRAMVRMGLSLSKEGVVLANKITLLPGG